MGCGAIGKKRKNDVEDTRTVTVGAAGVEECNGTYRIKGMCDGKTNWRKIDGSGERIWFCGPGDDGPYGPHGTWFLGNPKTYGGATYYHRCMFETQEVEPPSDKWKPWIYASMQEQHRSSLFPALSGTISNAPSRDLILQERPNEKAVSTTSLKSFEKPNLDEAASESGWSEISVRPADGDGRCEASPVHGAPRLRCYSDASPSSIASGKLVATPEQRAQTAEARSQLSDSQTQESSCSPVKTRACVS